MWSLQRTCQGRGMHQCSLSAVIPYAESKRKVRKRSEDVWLVISLWNCLPLFRLGRFFLILQKQRPQTARCKHWRTRTRNKNKCKLTTDQKIKLFGNLNEDGFNTLRTPEMVSQAKELKRSLGGWLTPNFQAMNFRRFESSCNTNNYFTFNLFNIFIK